MCAKEGHIYSGQPRAFPVFKWDINTTEEKSTWVFFILQKICDYDILKEKKREKKSIGAKSESLQFKIKQKNLLRIIIVIDP